MDFPPEYVVLYKLETLAVPVIQIPQSETFVARAFVP